MPGSQAIYLYRCCIKEATLPDDIDLVQATAAVTDPTTSRAALQSIAASFPSLGAAVAQHPNAYPKLLEWLASFGAEDAQEAATRRLGETTSTSTILEPPPPPPTPALQRLYALLQSHRLALIIGGGIVMIVAVALILTFTVFLPNSNTERNFTTAVAAYQQAQTDLSTQLSAAQTVAGYSDPGALDSPDVLSKLNTDIQSAQQNTGAPAPPMAKNKSEIRQQTSDLQAKTNTMKTQAGTLQSDVQAVQASALAWAKAALTTAISDANQVYSQYSYSPDTASLNNLQDQINQAQQVLDGLDQADPSTYTSASQASINSLSNAQAAVIAKAPVKCGNIILPLGIDPMVCGGIPASARTFPIVVDSWSMFEMPSHNIACYSNGYGETTAATCEIKNHSWKFPSEFMTQCNIDTDNQFNISCDPNMVILYTDGTVGMGEHSDTPPWYVTKMYNVKLPVLQYGQTVSFGSAACLSASDGVTCWNVTNHHGYKMSASHFYYW